MKLLPALFILGMALSAESARASNSCSQLFDLTAVVDSAELKQLGFSDSVRRRILNEESPQIRDQLIQLDPTKNKVEIFYRGLSEGPENVHYNSREHTTWAALDEFYAFSFALSAGHGNQIFRGSLDPDMLQSISERIEHHQKTGKRNFATVMEIEAVGPLISVKSWESKGKLRLTNTKTYIRRIGVMTIEHARALLVQASTSGRGNIIPSMGSFDWYEWDQAMAAGIVKPHQVEPN